MGPLYIRTPVFVMRTLDSTHMEFEYVKWSTYIKFWVCIQSNAFRKIRMYIKSTYTEECVNWGLTVLRILVPIFLYPLEPNPEVWKFSLVKVKKSILVRLCGPRKTLLIITNVASFQILNVYSTYIFTITQSGSCCHKWDEVYWWCKN
jgi:hypothetical protein